MRCIYSIVRFVPDPARGEFVNVAAIVGSEESSEWGYRQLDNPVRARHLDESDSLVAVWQFLNRVGREIDQHEEGVTSLLSSTPQLLSEDWLWKLQDDHQNIVQLSTPTPMVAENVEEALSTIYEEMILDPSPQKRGFKTKHAVLSETLKAYDRYGLRRSGHLAQHVPLRTEFHRQTVDFAVRNGIAVQLTQTWSFEVPAQEELAEQIKAWGWTMADLRKAGGRLSVKNEEVTVEPNVEIDVIFIPPTEGKSASAMRDAEHVFDSLQISPTRVERADEVGKRALELLGPPSGFVDLPEAQQRKLPPSKPPELPGPNRS